MAAIDLHPDVVEAIRSLSHTKLGRRYNRFARKRYGVRGPILAGKTVAGEFGGRSTRTGRGVVSSAGARGPAQFIPSTRDAYKQQYGVDPWKNDKQAIKGMMIHHLNTGVEGYNPGMSTYRQYILGQQLEPSDRRDLRGANSQSQKLAGPMRTQVKLDRQTTPGVSFERERAAARADLLLGGDITLDRLLEYKRSVKSLKDVPARTTYGDLEVERRRGKSVKVPAKTKGGPAGRRAAKGGGEIYEVFHDPLGRYYDNGQVIKGAIGGHQHVHVAGTREYVDRLGRVAQGMGLSVGENPDFGGVGGGHVEGSFHYEDMAIDVGGGTPALRRKFARIAMREAQRRGRGR